MLTLLTQLHRFRFITVHTMLLLHCVCHVFLSSHIVLLVALFLCCSESFCRVCT